MSLSQNTFKSEQEDASLSSSLKSLKYVDLSSPSSLCIHFSSSWKDPFFHSYMNRLFDVMTMRNTAKKSAAGNGFVGARSMKTQGSWVMPLISLIASWIFPVSVFAVNSNINGSFFVVYEKSTCLSIWSCGQVKWVMDGSAHTFKEPWFGLPSSGPVEPMVRLAKNPDFLWGSQ